jgi:hypothetical protein
MTKTFVAINDPVHSLIRGLPRHTPLCTALSADQRLTMYYSFRQEDLPEAYVIYGDAFGELEQLCFGGRSPGRNRNQGLALAATADGQPTARAKGLADRKRAWQRSPGLSETVGIVSRLKPVPSSSR